MFKHYLTTALRHFRRHKTTTGINVACLTVGLVCFLGVYAMITYLGSADRHFENADRVFLIKQGMNSGFTSPFSSFVAAKFLKTEFPEAEHIARATFNSGVDTEVPVSAGDRKGFAYVTYADPEFLDIFRLPFLAGDSSAALREPHSAVITKDTAVRLFGDDERVVGRRLRLQDGTELTVRGVIGNAIQPSHIRTQGEDPTPFVRFDVLISMDVMEGSLNGPPTWSSFPWVFTYFVLPKDGSLTPAGLSARLDGFAKRLADTNSTKITFRAGPLSDLFLDGMGAMARSDRRAPITMFYILGFIVLLVSCLNYANLATAHASTRAKEIGMRRVVGANRSQIALQFMMEAALLTMAAMVCAMVLVACAIAIVGIPSAVSLIATIVSSSSFWLSLAALLIFVTFAAGAYPAFVLSGLRPLQAVGANRSRSGPRVPRLLVVLQFTGACFLLIAMLVSETQNRLIKASALDSSSDTWIVAANDVRAAGVDFDVLQSELMRQRHIKSVTGSVVSPWMMMTMTASVAQSPDAGAYEVKAAENSVNYDFFDTLRIGLLAGRTFDRERDASSVTSASANQAPNVVIDKSLAEQNGWVRPQDSIGKTLYVFDLNKRAAPRTVVGVVESRPMTVMTPDGSRANMYYLAPLAATHPIIRVAGSDIASAFTEIESVWGKLAPSVALKMRLADDLMNRNYQAMQLVTSSFRAIALLALGISVLGLIGMSFHVIGRRQHELGVRKVLGASVRDNLRLLLIGFSKPIFVANVIAWPLAFMTMKAYLTLFTQRIELSPLPFVEGLVMTLVVACAAVFAQSSRAARTSPAVVLRNE